MVLKGFLFFQYHRGNGNGYEPEREEKSREMKQEMPPLKGTSLFKANLHKQDKCQHDHKTVQANMEPSRWDFPGAAVGFPGPECVA